MNRLRLAAVAAALLALGVGLWLFAGGAKEGAAANPFRRSSAKARSALSPADAPLFQMPSSPSEEPLDVSASLEVLVLANGAPQPGAAVALSLLRRDSYGGGRGWRAAGAGATDAKGLAELRVGPGEYLLSVRSEAWPRAWQKVAMPQGERVTRVEVQLAAASSITGRVLSKKGREPVPLADVALTPVVEGFPASPPAEEQTVVRSDGRGEFRFDAVAPGRYAVEATAAGHAKPKALTVRAPTSAPLELVLGPASYLEGRVVEQDGQPVADAEVVAMGRRSAWATTTGSSGTFSLEVAPGHVELSARKGTATAAADPAVVVAGESTAKGITLVLGKPASITGRVVDAETRRPVAGAQVSVWRNRTRSEVARTHSDDRGQFNFESLSRGAYDVEVLSGRYRSRYLGGITLVQGQAFNLELALTKGAAVDGRVVDPQGRGIDKAWVEAGLAFSPGAGQARTDAEGRFRIDGLPAGQGVVKARQAPASPAVVGTAELAEGKTASVGELVLATAGHIEGTVRRQEGGPLTTVVTVTALPAGAGRPRDRVGSAVAAADGSFRLPLQPGSYNLSAVTEDARESGRTPVPVEVQADRGTRVELLLSPRQTRLRGVVLEAAGAPSVGAMVSYTPAGGRSTGTALSDDEGRFEVHSPDWNEGQVILVAQNGGRKARAVVDSKAGEVTLTLEAAASISGRFLLTSAAPQNGFIVFARVAAAEGTSVSLGRGEWRFPEAVFRIPDAQPGLTDLTVRTEDGRTGAAQLRVIAGEDNTVEIRITGEATVVGRVVDDATGKPIAEAQLSVGFAWFSTDAEGRFQLAQQVPKPCSLVVIAKGYRPLRRELTLYPDQTLELGDLRMSAAGPDLDGGALPH